MDDEDLAPGPWLPEPMPILGMLLVVAIAIGGIVVAACSARALLVAGIRIAIGLAAIGAGLLLSGIAADVVAFAGKAFVALAVYGLVAPLESAVTGAVADAIERDQ